VGKLQTLISVLRTFGLMELFWLLFRKLRQSQTSIKYYPPKQSQTLDEIDLKISLLIGCPLAELKSARSDFIKDTKPASTLSQTRQSFFGSEFDLGENASYVLFILCRTLKMSLILETGVAAGQSSDMILQALSLNEAGHLYSIDITNQVGELIREEHKSRWTLKVLPKFFRRQALLEIVEGLGDIDLFVHDSDHSASWQKVELSSVMNRLHPPRLLLFDDVSDLVIREFELRYPNFEMFFVYEKFKRAALFVRRNNDCN